MKMKSRTGYFAVGMRENIQEIMTKFTPSVIVFMLILLLVPMESPPTSASASAAKAHEAEDKHQILKSMLCESDGSCKEMKNDPIDDSNDDECTLFLAPSSIPNAGFGVYTTKSHTKHSTFLESDSPSIAIFDIELHQCHKSSKKQDAVGEMMHYNYVWESDSPPESNEAETTEMSVLTMGSLPNYHTGLVNVEQGDSKSYDDLMLDRFVDPGAGAFSYHLGSNWDTTRYIEAGEEIFISYGSEYLSERDYLGDVPRSKDFKNGKKVLKEIEAFLKRKIDAGEKVDDADLLTFKNIISIYSKRSASLFPKTYASFLELTRKEEKNPLAWSTIKKRSIDWIKENGICLDNIRMDKSSIPQAGHGGFARRFLAKGQVIAPAPLIQIMDRDLLKMYKIFMDEDDGEMGCDPDDEEPDGEQLLLNYCFGHDESSLLLCPVTNAIIINHCSDRQDWGGQCGDNEGPNAMYRWAIDWDKDTDEWLTLTLDEIHEKNNDEERGLSLEIVATRDIQPGEEIFIDYGIQWENAWNNHVENWKPPAGDFVSFSSVTRMNDEGTIEDLAAEPYPSNMFTGCVYWEDEEEDGIDENRDIDWKTLDDEELITMIGRSGEKYVSTRENYWYAKHHPCTVYKRDGDEDKESYIVHIRQTHELKSWENDTPRILTKYPRESISFFGKRYSSDQHMPGAFRQPIGIRDEIFPVQWKDLSNDNDKEEVEDTDDYYSADDEEDSDEDIYDGGGEEEEDYYEDTYHDDDYDEEDEDDYYEDIS